MYYEMMVTLPSVEDMEIMTKTTSTRSHEIVDIYPVSQSSQTFLRACAICGIGSFIRPGYGLGNELSSDYKLQRYTCGTVNVPRLLELNNYDVEKLPSSEALVEWLFDWIDSEDPDILFIHNGYKFDIHRLCVHAKKSRSVHFGSKNLGKLGKGMDLLLPGCYVIDTYWYLDKVHRHRFETMKLDDIAEELGLGGKAEQPEMMVDPDNEDVDLTDMVYYNVLDAYLHLCIGIKSGMVVDWSPDGMSSLKVEGARVFTPVTGLHHNVAVMDFSSMYPSIMVTCNISPETVHDFHGPSLESQKHKLLSSLGVTDMNGKDSITWDAEHVYFRLSNATGHDTDTSRISMWWLITVAEAVCFALGYSIIYGDTDSVFISQKSERYVPEETVLMIFHRVLHFTPFRGVNLAFEKYLISFLLLGRKTYFGYSCKEEQRYDSRNQEVQSYISKVKIAGIGEIEEVTRGIAVRRKDRPPVLRETCLMVKSLEGIGLTFVHNEAYVRGQHDRQDEYGSLVQVPLQDFMSSTYVFRPSKDRLFNSIITACEPLVLASKLPSIAILLKCLTASMERDRHDDYTGAEASMDHNYDDDVATESHVNVPENWESVSGFMTSYQNVLITRRAVQDYSSYPPEAWFSKEQDLRTIFIPRISYPLVGFPFTNVDGAFSDSASTISGPRTFRYSGNGKDESCIKRRFCYLGSQRKPRQCRSGACTAKRRMLETYTGEMLLDEPRASRVVPPMHVIDSTTIYEIERNQDLFTDDRFRVMNTTYSGLIDTTLHRTIIGSIHDNTLVDTRPYEDTVNPSLDPDVARRQKAKKYDPSARDLRQDLESMLCYIYEINVAVVISLVHKFRCLKGYNVPSLHIDTGKISYSTVETETLYSPELSSELYVDSFMIKSDVCRALLGFKLPDRTSILPYSAIDLSSSPGTLPNVPLLVVFLNSKHNYEDSIIVNNRDVGSVKIGPVTPDLGYTWLRPSDKTDIVSVNVSKSGDSHQQGDRRYDLRGLGRPSSTSTNSGSSDEGTRPEACDTRDSIGDDKAGDLSHYPVFTLDRSRNYTQLIIDEQESLTGSKAKKRPATCNVITKSALSEQDPKIPEHRQWKTERFPSEIRGDGDTNFGSEGTRLYVLGAHRQL
ncbi:hypothetical protein DFJ73DRAFT_763211 [Zopfochytrium polystomum]|nr:hypothetical protein DFJ73DRAFT_763211 [Zopfochytrium polystomum]